MTDPYRSLVNELTGFLSVYSNDMRYAAGNTNVAVLQEKLEAARSALSRDVAQAESMARLSASEYACYRWPEDTAEHRAMRAAFCDGAAHVVGVAQGQSGCGDLEHVRSAMATLSDPLTITVDGHLTGTARALAIIHAMRDIAATALLHVPAAPQPTSNAYTSPDLQTRCADFKANHDMGYSAEDLTAFVAAVIDDTIAAPGIAYTVPNGFVLVPNEPTNAMLKAACMAMSPTKRPTPDRVSVKQKHKIRYQAMIAAAPCAVPAEPEPALCPDCGGDLAGDGHNPSCPRGGWASPVSSTHRRIGGTP